MGSRLVGGLAWQGRVRWQLFLFLDHPRTKTPQSLVMRAQAKRIVHTVSVHHNMLYGRSTLELITSSYEFISHRLYEIRRRRDSRRGYS
jgi:hypothetical protein